MHDFYILLFCIWLTDKNCARKYRIVRFCTFQYFLTKPQRVLEMTIVGGGMGWGRGAGDGCDMGTSTMLIVKRLDTPLCT